MRLLVTGGAGFIGSNLIRHVLDRPEIELLVNLDCLTYAGHRANVEDLEGHTKYRFEQIDLRDKLALLDALERHAVTHVMHLAAESHVDRSIAGPGSFIHTNIVGTFHLLEVCRELWIERAGAGNPPGGYRFHHVSTDEVYGIIRPTGAFCEPTPYVAIAPYPAAVIPVKASDARCVEEAEKIYRALGGCGIEAVIDDRDERPGVKFKDADLIGFPYKAIVGPKGLKEGRVEIKSRRTGETEMVPLEGAARALAERIGREREPAA